MWQKGIDVFLETVSSPVSGGLISPQERVVRPVVARRIPQN